MILAIEGCGPLAKSSFRKGEIVVGVGAKTGNIPTTRVGLPNNDQGNTLTRSKWQRRHRS